MRYVSTLDINPARNAAKNIPSRPVGIISFINVAIALSASAMAGLCAKAIMPGMTIAKGINIFNKAPKI